MVTAACLYTYGALQHVDRELMYCHGGLQHMRRAPMVFLCAGVGKGLPLHARRVFRLRL